MSPDEIQVALQAAFHRCDAASCPLTDTQQKILLQVVEQIKGNNLKQDSEIVNPLDELNPQELKAFLDFVSTQEQQNQDWKVQLLNDWLHENNSGAVQFIRDCYGLQWLERIQGYHLEKYVVEDKLKVGSHIEVCNRLWEWVNENSPCKPEWFPCTVIRVDQIRDGDDSLTNCTIRFHNGAEYEIQGIYDWNRYNWRRFGENP
ncbi:MAG: hypothetical protein QNJ47_20075 [Nostocaceae cyanobacterium]|nr:hypothetical protein [Nostocaceae cyanobacterium]